MVRSCKISLAGKEKDSEKVEWDGGLLAASQDRKRGMGQARRYLRAGANQRPGCAGPVAAARKRNAIPGWAF